MFCPRCRAEYREGFTECAECKVPLIEILPDLPEEESEEYVAVVTSTDLSELMVIKSILESADIPYFTRGEEVLGLFPGLPEGQHSGPDGGLVSVHVPVAMAQEAIELLKHLEDLPADEENEQDPDGPEQGYDW
ncbi:DUF2007 domain-containing protein [bacterium]|nr:DUF2007 domain-containing protein [bacterium]